jgi:hypothetical protein
MNGKRNALPLQAVQRHGKMPQTVYAAHAAVGNISEPSNKTLRFQPAGNDTVRKDRQGFEKACPRQANFHRWAVHSVAKDI